MAEILPLPCPVDHERARRLAEVLAVKIEQGCVLGPRDAQIRSLGASIDTLVQALRSELEELGIGENLETLTGGLERLARLARAYHL